MKSLDEDMGRFFSTHPYAIGGKYNAEAAEITLYATSLMGPFPTIEWGVRIGDCLHNLRSALDHVVWQLALLHLQRQPTDKEARRIQFPIEHIPERFEGARVRPLPVRHTLRLARPVPAVQGWGSSGPSQARHPPRTLQHR